MATGKVRIFELAKELNMTSKDMIVLFGRLGLEAKNQLSVVEPKVADLLRLQLGKAAAAKLQAKPSAVASPPAGPVADAPKDATVVVADAAPVVVSTPRIAAGSSPVAASPSVEARVATATDPTPRPLRSKPPEPASPKPASTLPRPAAVPSAVSTLKPVPNVSRRTQAAPASSAPAASTDVASASVPNG